MYEERFYRKATHGDFCIEVCYKESDLLIYSDRYIDKTQAFECLKNYYHQVEEYARLNPVFLTTLSSMLTDKNAPEIVREMQACSQVASVGPFASVAGAIASYVGKAFLSQTGEIIVENGGDIFLKINSDKRIGVYLGEHFSDSRQASNLALKIKKREYPFGIASSSAYIGHSLNFGMADLVTVLAETSSLADGFATAISNRIKSQSDVDAAISCAKNNPKISGLLIAIKGKIFIWGELEIDA
ncbi:MAG: UPF0280 family protein [Candidatus Omnitrophica bacterium]|nr:UPF0280 family protein [Candidatus Omnitrophota bacterium]